MPVDLVKNVRRRSTPAIIYWEVEKERRLISLSSSLARGARLHSPHEKPPSPFTIFIDTKCENSSPYRRHLRSGDPVRSGAHR